MKKAIKKITLYSILIALGFLVKYYVIEDKVSGRKSQFGSSTSTNSGEEGEGLGNTSDNNSVTFNDYAKTEIPSMGGGGNLSKSTESVSGTTSIADIGVSNANSNTMSSGLSAEEDFKESVANNNSYVDNGSSYSNNYSNSYYNGVGGPNANNAEGSMLGSEVSSSNATTSSSASAATASRTASGSGNASSASRVSGSGSGSVGLSAPPPVIEAPGSPGGGGDPYVPIDDYYGLFALLLCGTVLFWYRNKQSKLVKVKA